MAKTIKSTWVPVAGARTGGKFVKPDSPRPQPAGIHQPRSNEATCFGECPRATYSPSPAVVIPDKKFNFVEAPSAAENSLPNPPQHYVPHDTVRFGQVVRKPIPAEPLAPVEQKADPRVVKNMPRAEHNPSPVQEIVPAKVIRFDNTIRKPEPVNYTPPVQKITKPHNIPQPQ
ncbi:MAG: hypothetical protein ABSD89_11410 [Halobacteriota archaeon]|jgi:hypothetical protein